MRFSQENVIEFNVDGSLSHAYAVMTVVDGCPHVAFAPIDGHGQSPTNAFEKLAEFVWSERYPTVGFDRIRWFDLQVDRMSQNPENPGPMPFNIFPVKLVGDAGRQTLFGMFSPKDVTEAPQPGDTFSVMRPKWESNKVSFDRLPAEFQERIQHNMIIPYLEGVRRREAAQVV